MSASAQNDATPSSVGDAAPAAHRQDAAGAIRLVVIAGRAGAGRRTAINALEDIGFETVDTPPIEMTAQIIRHLLSEGRRDIAVGLCSRSGAASSEAWRGMFDEIAAMLVAIKAEHAADGRSIDARSCILFLDCADEVLIRRYTETRRRHPMADDGAIEVGLERDRRATASVRDAADMTIDTSHLSAADLRREVLQRFDRRGGRLTISVVSFSYRKGLPAEADLVFDCRFLRNPHYVEALQPLDGRNAAVAGYVAEDPGYAPFMAHLKNMADALLPAYQDEGKSYLTVAFGCTGGKHRSVAVAEAFAKSLRECGWRLHLRHRERDEAGDGGEAAAVDRRRPRNGVVSGMIGIVVVAHGGLADELLKATEHIVGDLPSARAIGLGPKDDLAERRSEIEAAIVAVDDGDGVIVLADLFGGTPSNLAIAAMARDGVDVVTGVNLPMMLLLAKRRSQPRDAVVRDVVDAGRKYIIAANDVLGGGAPGS